MKSARTITLLAAVAVLSACAAKTVVVSVPPRVDLRPYGTIGIVDFASNSDAAVNAQATRKFQEEVQAAQPGTRFVELGDRQTVLASIGSRQLDLDAYKKIGNKYGVSAVFVGDVVYSEPRADIKLADLQKLEGGMRAE